MKNHDATFRPRISEALACAIRSAAGAAGMSVSVYLDRKVLPVVQADLSRRLGAMGLGGMGGHGGTLAPLEVPAPAAAKDS